jgi:hypothetical protein
VLVLEEAESLELLVGGCVATRLANLGVHLKG